MATVCHPGTGRVTASFAGVAKHYGVSVAICPPRRGHRKGVVEKANHTAAQRWWRTLADDVTVEQAQAGVDRFAAARGDTRMRPAARRQVHASPPSPRREPLRPAPAIAVSGDLAESRTVSRQALVAFRGNRYSVPPELAGAQVTVRRPVGRRVIDIATASGIVIARHRLAGDGAGALSATTDTSSRSNSAAMAASSNRPPHRRKERIPPGPQALPPRSPTPQRDHNDGRLRGRRHDRTVGLDRGRPRPTTPPPTEGTP